MKRTQSSLSILFTLVVLFSSAASAQDDAKRKGLAGCLDSFGNLHSLVPFGDSVTCPDTDIKVALGSGDIQYVSAGDGLVADGSSATIKLEVLPDFSIPPSCPQGEVAISNGNGEWGCALSSAVHQPNPSAKMWILPNYPYAFDSSRTIIRMLNPSIVEGQVQCLFFNVAGDLLSDLTYTGSINAGAWARISCVAWSGSTRETNPASLLIVSDVNVLVSAVYQNTGSVPEGLFRSRPRYSSERLEAYPIDCRNPEGVERLCQYGLD